MGQKVQEKQKTGKKKKEEAENQIKIRTVGP